MEFPEPVAGRPLDHPRHHFLSERSRTGIAGARRQAARALALEFSRGGVAGGARLARLAVCVRRFATAGLRRRERAAWRTAPRRRGDPEVTASLHPPGAAS